MLVCGRITHGIRRDRERRLGPLLSVSGATANPLHHKHPHDPEELTPPDDIREQTRRVMENLKLVLDAAGATFQDVVKVRKYLTRMDEQDAVWAVMKEYFAITCRHRRPSRSAGSSWTGCASKSS
ncbi:MAG TPA: RidA family protein [Chloroflexota bacterium]|nr:RidA family protein [Chloroflexota bacterium]